MLDLSGEQFQVVFPNQLYQGYQAFESSDVEYSGYRKRIIEEERKKTIRYYDAINYSGFDRFINSASVKIGPQVIFELQIKYEKVSE